MTDVPQAYRRWFRAAAALVAVLALGRLWWLPVHASHNINEGWNAGHVARALGPGLLYPTPDALIANNYPPLSFLIVGALDRVVGDAVITGRVVSLIGEVAVAWAVCLLVLRLTRARVWATAGAVVFALAAATLLRSYLLMNDPQWLGQAFMAWTLVLLVPRERDGPIAPGRIIGAAALTVAGVLVKHNLVAITAAATLWLLIVDRRALAVWAAGGLMFGALAGGGLYAIWGADVFADVLAPARSYSALRMAAHGVPLLLFALPGLLAARPLLRHWREDRRRLLPLLLLAIAIPTALIQRSGDGVDINATFESVFVLALAVPLGCALRPVHAGRWLVIAVVPMLGLVPVATIADVREIAGRDAAVARAQPFITRIAAEPGAVACDDQALCHWAGRTSALDFFAMKQRLLKGDVPRLRAALDAHAFGLIAMRSENPGWHENRLIPLIRARYRTIYREGGSELLVPR